MSLTLEQIKDAAADLPPGERTQLATYLLRDPILTMGPDVRAEWLALAESRLNDLETGRAVGIPADEVLDSLLRAKS